MMRIHRGVLGMHAALDSGVQRNVTPMQRKHAPGEAIKLPVKTVGRAYRAAVWLHYYISSPNSSRAYRRDSLTHGRHYQNPGALLQGLDLP